MRRATVTYSLGERETVPMIRLRGKWLRRAGFEEGTRIEVVVSAGTLTLTVAEPETGCVG